MQLSGTDLDNVTRTIMAEAGENATPASIAAVASVIRNRIVAGGYGRTPTEIVHAPYQFSPWNENSSNDPGRFPADSAGYRQAAALAQDVFSRPRRHRGANARKFQDYSGERGNYKYAAI
jgi:spore germination cell wall hydrolase CwlJ-like protein